MYFKASYTVEGSVVICICLILIGISMILAFDLYKESIEYINTIAIKEIDSVEMFRQFRVVSGVIDWFTGNE